MKNRGLLLFLTQIFIFSCTTTPNLQVKPSVKPTVSVTPSVTNTVKPSTSSNPISSASPSSITPSITVTPSISPLGEFDKMRIYSETGLVMNELLYSSYINKTYDEVKYQYNSLGNETIKFNAEYIDKNGNINKDVIWSVSDPNLASINQDGILTIRSNIGRFSVTATSKMDVSKKLSFAVNIYDTLKYFICDGKIEKTKDKFEYVGSVAVSDFRERATVNGKVYDPSGIPVEGATVYIQSLTPNVTLISEPQITVNGAYVFRDIPYNIKVAITVIKDGWTSRTRTETIQPPVYSECYDPNKNNIFDFGGNNVSNIIYAIHDEPEITQLKINGKTVNSSSNGDEFIIDKNVPKNIKPTTTQLANNNQITGVGNISSLTGINSNTLEVEMTFSEPVRTDDVRNYFRIISQQGFDSRESSFTVDANYSGVDFTVSADEKTITFKTNKAILANRGSAEAKYLIDFSQPFRDKTDKSAIDRRLFRFSDTQINDFAIFSVKSDEESPKLLGITARDGGSANDSIELRYSEPMELFNQASYPAGLSDPLAPLNLSRQTWYRDANNSKANAVSQTVLITDNNATLVGFLSNSDSNTSQFKASYMIGRILSKDVINGTPKLSILGSINRTPITTPVKGNTVANDLLRNVRITGSNVLIEFSPTAFDRDDRVVVTVGNKTYGSYVDRNRTPNINEELTVDIEGIVNFAQIYDPAGRLIDTGNSTTSANIDVNNSQRVATAS